MRKLQRLALLVALLAPVSGPVVAGDGPEAEERVAFLAPECLQSTVWFTDHEEGQWPPPGYRLPATAAVVDVALLDGAADRDHPAVAGLWAGGDDLVDGDGDPFFPPGGPTLEDRGLLGNAHATAVASVLAQAGPNLRLHLYRVLDDDCRGLSADLALAVDRAVGAGARVIVIAAGGQIPSPLLRAAIARASELDVLVVAAAGNDASPSLDYPARDGEAVAVAALTGAGQPAPFTSFGRAVTVSDYGIALDVALAGGGWTRASGTSLAAARTAAAAVVLRGELPWLSAAEVRRLLTASAAPLAPADRSLADKLGAGRTDAAAALSLGRRLGGGAPALAH